jgi:pimeloyl-ACP methyl ester carboxylesterase
MTTPPELDGLNIGPPRGPTDRHAELMELAEVIGQGIHALSHTAADIARELRAIRERLDQLAPIVQAYDRGGKLAAWTAARQSRREDRTP